MRFIRTRQVLRMIGVGRTTLWRMVQEGSFPRPVRVTQRNSGYLLEAVHHWMETRAQGLPWDPATMLPSSPEVPGRRRRPKVGLVRHATDATRHQRCASRQRLQLAVRLGGPAQPHLQVDAVGQGPNGQ